MSHWTQPEADHAIRNRHGRVSVARRAACMAVAAAALLIAAPSPATAAPPTKGASYHYGDFSSDTAEVHLGVSRHGRSLADVSLSLFMRCSNGVRHLGSLLWTPGLESPRRVPIARDGSFSAVFAEPEFPHPFTVSEEYWLSGRFVRRGKAARLVVRTRHFGEGGTVCDTGDRRATARRVPQGRS